MEPSFLCPAMVRAVWVLGFLLLACFDHLQVAQSHDEALSEADFLCIRQSRQETALGRWLDCLHALDADKEDEQPTTEYGLDMYLETEERLVITKKPRNDPPTIKEEEIRTQKVTVDTSIEEPSTDDPHTEEPMVIKKEPQNDSPSIMEEETQNQQNTIDSEEPVFDNKHPQSERRNGDWNDMLIHNELPCGLTEGKGGRQDDSPPTHIDAGGAEDSRVSGSSNAVEAATIELRDMGEHTYWGWLRLNLGMLALGKLLLRMVRRCKRSDTSPETRATSLANDSVTVVSELKSGADTATKEEGGASHLRMLGTSLGSAVGAVLAEVILKMGSSGFPLSADKSTRILESALVESCTLVQDDAECSKLLVGFTASFKSTYAMLYRIHQASSSCEDRKDVNCMCSGIDKSFMTQQTSTFVGGKQFGPNNNLEMDPMPDVGQEVQKVVPLSSSTSSDDKEVKSFLTANPLPEEHESSGMVANDDDGGGDDDDDGGDTIHFGSSFTEQAKVSERDVHPQADSDGQEDTVFIDKVPMPNTEVAVKEIVEAVLRPEYEVDDASSVCEEPSSITRSGMLAFMDRSLGEADYQKVFLSVFERHVQAQEQHNQLKYVEVKHLMKQRALEEEKLRLTQDANVLMRENIDLGRSKACFKEVMVLDKQAKDVYASFSKTCADELVAGLCVMLASLLYGTRKYSVRLLSELVATCQPSVKEPRRPSAFHVDWFYTSLDTLAAKLQTLLCNVTVTARILVGGILGITLVSALLRRSVTSSSQAMPATVLIVVLGGVCGYVGKLSVDSLGGSGTQWCAMWEIFCFLHAFTNCFTPLVYKLIYGGPLSGCKAKFGPPFWIRKLAFHCMLLVVLPGLAGQLPFASLYHVMNDLSTTTVEVWSALVLCVSEWLVHVISISQRMLVQYVQ